MSNPPAFHAPQIVAYDAAGQPVYQQPNPVFRITPEMVDLECDNCGQVFQLGEPAVELYLGIVGRGEKSGRPMVVDDPNVEHPENTNTWIVHPQCAVECITHHICDWGEDEAICAICEQRIEDD